MALTRRDLLGMGTLAGATLLSGCTTIGTPPTAAQPIPTGATPSSPPPPESSLSPRDVPSPRYSSFGPDDAGAAIDGNNLDQRLAALGKYSGGPLRTVRIRAGKYVRTTPIVLPSGVRLVAAGATFSSSIPGAQVPLLQIANVTDVSVEGGTWDGNKSHSSVVSEWKHAIQVMAATRVNLEGLVVKNATGDGIYVGSHETPCRDITIASVKATKNGRNGMSVTSCRGMRCRDSIFTDNGDRAPHAGVDLEPNSRRAPMTDLEFLRCSFTNNGSRGFLVVMQRATPDIKDGIRLIDCTIDKNANPWGGSTQCGGLVLIRPRGVLVSGGTIQRSHVGITIQGRRSADPKTDTRGTVRIVNVDVHDNLREGLLVLTGIKALTVDNVRFFDNSREDAGYFSGIMLARGSNMTFTDCVSTGARMYGLQASDPVKKVRLIRCGLGGNGKGALNTGRAGVKVIK